MSLEFSTLNSVNLNMMMNTGQVDTTFWKTCDKLEVVWYQNNKLATHHTRTHPKNEFGKIELAFDSTFLCDVCFFKFF